MRLIAHVFDVSLLIARMEPTAEEMLELARLVGFEVVDKKERELSILKLEKG